MHHAVANGHAQLAHILCEFGSIDNLLESSDKDGNTPLFLAIKFNQTECVKVLISYNVNFFHKNKKGDSCLHMACQHNAQECLITLSNYVGDQMF